MGGIDIKSNPHVIDLFKKQLKKIGIQLLAVYYFSEWSGISLVIGKKSSKLAALYYAYRVSHNPEITCFHGRAEVNPNIEKAYDFLKEFNSNGLFQKIKFLIS